jgi:hypothetical protein
MGRLNCLLRSPPFRGLRHAERAYYNGPLTDKMRDPR